MSTNPPSHDQTMTLLGQIMENYSFRDFSLILRDPERLKAWLQKEIPKQEEEREDLPELEEKAWAFWGEINQEDRERIKTAFMELWGKEGRGTLPIRMSER